ncbi:MAG: phage head-tail connector protein [Cetobacterium sp.]
MIERREELIIDIITIMGLKEDINTKKYLNRLLDNLVEDIELECNIDLSIEKPKGLYNLLCEIAIFRMKKIKDIELTSETIAELSKSYSNDYPNYILKRLKALRRARTW